MKSPVVKQNEDPGDVGFILGCFPKHFVAEVPTHALLLSQPLPLWSFREDTRWVARAHSHGLNGTQHTEADLKTLEAIVIQVIYL